MPKKVTETEARTVFAAKLYQRARREVEEEYRTGLVAIDNSRLSPSEKAD